MNNHPKISVLMSVYNTREEYLREAIESILNQTYGAFEFMIIDDGSTNNAQEVILSYDDKRIRYVKNEKNIGLIDSLNKGLGLCQGEYIARMDSDDISAPERFEKQVKALDENQNLGVVGSFMKGISEEIIYEYPTSHDEIRKFMLLVGSAMAHPTVMMRSKIFTEHNCFYNKDDKYAEDYGLWLSLLDKVEFANINEPLLNYRYHHESVSRQNASAQRETATLLRTRYQKEVFGVDFSSQAKSYLKVEDGEVINVKELSEIVKYIEYVLYNIKDDTSYYKNLYKSVYKNAIKHTKGDKDFYNILWKSPLNKRFGVDLFYKIKYTIKSGMKRI